VAIEEGELLLAVGGIVGRIQVDRDAGGAALEPPPMCSMTVSART